MNITTTSKKLLSPFILFCCLITSTTYAEEIELCEPFKDANIDSHLLSTMLQAAEDGYLYRIKPESSMMKFCVDSPLGMVQARFKNFNGGLALTQSDNDSPAMIILNVDSLESDSIIIEAMLKSEIFFDSEQYPNILFVSSGIEWINKTKGVIKGELTLHGVTKTIAFYVNIKKTQSDSGSDIISIVATTTIKRSEFGMYTLYPIVDDRVNLCMSVDAYRHRPEVI